MFTQPSEFAKPLPQKDANMLLDKVIEIWPEFEQYKSSIYIIYGGKGPEHSINYRDFNELIDEVAVALKQNKTKFIFTVLLEDFDTDIVHTIHRLITAVPNLRHENCFCIFGGSDYEGVYQSYLQKYGLTSKINILGFSNFERDYTFYRENGSLDPKFFPENPDFKYNVKVKEKKFLCFNKFARGHRSALLEKMLEKNLVKEAYYSFYGWYGPEEDLSWIDQYAKQHPIPNILNNRDIFPLKLNATKKRWNPIDIIESDLEYFDNSYFSVVTETEFYDNVDNPQTKSSVFFSEKTWKPIVMLHPFIMVGRVGWLRELQQMGYQTFHPYIDESYDNICDPIERLDAIANEIQRLCDKTNDQWREWQEAILPIVNHNREFYFQEKTHTKTPSLQHLLHNCVEQTKPKKNLTRGRKFLDTKFIP
jgi:hypothetical protein